MQLETEHKSFARVFYCPLFLCVLQHQSVVTDIFSIIKANLNQTTAKLNSMLLMGDDEERRILENSLKNENKRVRG